MQHSEAARLPQHVLMTLDAVGGVWTYALDLARMLGARGVHVSFALMGPSLSASQREEIDSIPTVFLYKRSCALEWMEEPWDEIASAGEWLLDLERALRPDVVHLNAYCHGALDWAAPVLVAGHSCVLSWWHAVHGTDVPVKWDEYARRVADGLRAADLVVAPTASMLSMLDFHYGPLGRSRVIANGRDAIDSVVEKEPFVLTAGRLWDQAKNVEAVAAAASCLPWPVYIAGESQHPSGGTVSYEAVRCLGRLSSRDLGAWMARAAIYVLPARYEPFGLSVLEAALAGCALVLGDIRSLREIWGDAAIYVAPDNRRALVTAVEQLAGDEEARQRLAAAAALRARQLTPRRMADAYLDAYETLVRDSLPLSA